jgi:hypothetical protein
MNRKRAYITEADILLVSRLRKIAAEVKRSVGKDVERKKEKCLEDFKTLLGVGGGITVS